MKSIQKRFSFVSFLFAALLFSLALAGCVEEPKKYTKADVKLKKYNWKGGVPERHKVRLVNPYGNVSTRNTNQSDIELAGVIQQVGADAPMPEVVFSELDGVMVIEVKYASPTKDEFNNRIARVDLGIYIPHGISLEVTTDFGDIKAKKHHSRIIAKTKSGKIKLSTHNAVTASSESGNIHLDLLSWKKSRFITDKKKNRYDLFSQQGNVKVYFKDTVDLAVHAESGYGIKTKDYLLNQEINNLRGANGNLVFQTVFGSGERELSIATPKGSINFSINRSDLTVASTAIPDSKDVSLNEISVAEPWKPGDPILERNDSRQDRKKQSK